MNIWMQVLSYLIISGFTYFWLWYLTWEATRHRRPERRPRRWWERDVRFWRKGT